MTGGNVIRRTQRVGALNRSLIGRLYHPACSYEVGRAKIAEFADAIGDKSPLSRDPRAARAAGYPDVIAPPTFVGIIVLAALKRVIADPDLGFDADRIMHREQSFEFRRAVRAGDYLTTAVRIEDISVHAGYDAMTVQGEIHDDAGLLVVAYRTRVIARRPRGTA